MYVVTTALILASALYTQANLLFWALGLMVGGLVVSIGWSWQTLRKVTVQRLLPMHGVAGEPLVLRYRLTNRGWLPVFGLVVSEAWGQRGRRRPATARTGSTGTLALPPQLNVRPQGWVLHLGPGQTVQAEATCWPLRRGLIHFDRVVLASSFPFGVIRKILKLEVAGAVLVYPPLYRMSRRVLGRLSRRNVTGRNHLDRAGGTEEFFGLRPYRAGDSLKMIDWKRSAKTNELITREMTQTSPPRIMLALDLTRRGGAADSTQHTPTVGDRRRYRPKSGVASYTAETDGTSERAISLAASLVCDAHFHGYPVGMVVLGVTCRAFPIHHSMPHRTKLLEALALLDTSARVSDLPAMPAEPTVIITPGRGSASPRLGGQVLLGAADMDQYVTHIKGGAAALLNPRGGATSRREAVRSAAQRPRHQEGVS